MPVEDEIQLEAES